MYYQIIIAINQQIYYCILDEAHSDHIYFHPSLDTLIQFIN